MKRLELLSSGLNLLTAKIAALCKESMRGGGLPYLRYFMITIPYMLLIDNHILKFESDRFHKYFWSLKIQRNSSQISSLNQVMIYKDSCNHKTVECWSSSFFIFLFFIIF